MIKFTLILLIFCSCIFIGAQTAEQKTPVPKEANTKKYPLEFRNTTFILNEGYKGRLNSSEKDSQDPKYSYMKYSDAQIARIDYLLKNNILPEFLKGENLEKNRDYLKYYNAYRIGNLWIDKKFYYIIYIPRDENSHMPAEMIPPTEEGIYFATLSAVPRFSKFTTRGKLPQNDGASVANNSRFSTSHSSADYVEHRSGVMVFWYGTLESITRYNAVEVDITGKISDEEVASKLSEKLGMGNNFVGFEYKPATDCRAIYTEIARKMNISFKEAQDSRIGNCSDNVMKFKE